MGMFRVRGSIAAMLDRYAGCGLRGGRSAMGRAGMRWEARLTSLAPPVKSVLALNQEMANKIVKATRATGA